MIPKIIHYCWFSKNPMPAEALECIKSWKKQLPGYTIKKWGSDSFDFNSVPFLRDAVKYKKWAFASDFIRCYALFYEGGIYLDTDVFVRKNMDFVLENRAFSAMECYPHLIEQIKMDGSVDENGDKVSPDSVIHGIQIQAAILGAEKGHPFFKDCLDYYLGHDFVIDENGNVPEGIISPIVFANIAVKYGFKYRNEEQSLDEGFHLYPVEMFCPQPYLMQEEAVAVHCCNGSWRRSEKSRLRSSLSFIAEYVKRFLNFINLRKERNIEKLK